MSELALLQSLALRVVSEEAESGTYLAAGEKAAC